MAQVQRGQDETPGTENSGTGGGVVEQHQEHKPGMAEKFKSTFSSLTGRMMGGGGSPNKATVDETNNQYNSGDAATAHSNPYSTEHMTKEDTQPYASVEPVAAPTGPGGHTNPYSIDHMANKQDGTNPYVSGGDGIAPSTPAANQSPSRSSGFAGKVKNTVTGEKAAHGTGSENATAGTAGTIGANGATDGYVQGPTPRERGDLYDRTKEYFARGDVGSEETWPSPAHSDSKNTTAATYSNAEGRPIDGPTQPHSEHTKKEALMTKLMDKLHLHQKSGSPKASSPRATTAGSNTGQNWDNTGA